jgi:hypothetical protein
MVASAQSRQGYDAVVDGVTMSLCVDDQGIIVEQSTKDATFRTPEGVCIGVPLDQVLARHKTSVVREPGWSYYVPLPSGWKAGLAMDDGRLDEPLPFDTPVRWLFMRGRVSRARTTPLPDSREDKPNASSSQGDGDTNPKDRMPPSSMNPSPTGSQEKAPGDGTQERRRYPWLVYELECDDSTRILASQYAGKDERYGTDSHGFIFADGEYWIDNSEVDILLKGDGYKKRGAGDKVRQGDVVVYRNADGDVEHSATVQKVDEETGKVRVKDKPGLRKPRDNVPTDGAWPGAAKIEYYFKEPPARAPQGCKDD